MNVLSVFESGSINEPHIGRQQMVDRMLDQVSELETILEDQRLSELEEAAHQISILALMTNSDEVLSLCYQIKSLGRSRQSRGTSRLHRELSDAIRKLTIDHRTPCAG